MSEKSPNSLKRPDVQADKMRKWPLYAGGLALLVLFCVLFYSVNFSGSHKKKEAKKTAPVSEQRLMDLEGSLSSNGGLAVQTPPQGGISGLSGAGDGRNEDRKEDEYSRNLRRQKEEEFTKALKSPLIAKRPADSGRQNNQQQATGTRLQTADVQARKTDSSAYLAKTGDNVYDPAADRDKEEFSTRSERDQWLSPYTREAGNMFEIKTGTVIPGIMVTGINSDLPGSMIAQVSQNVYDTASGDHLLIPQGSKLFGVYDSRIIYGQERVLIAWNRVIFPDGSAITLGAMPGADMSGYAGFTDQVNNHYLRIFGSALLMSLITGSTSYAMDSVSNSNNSTAQSSTVQDSMAAALAAQLGQTTLTLLQRNLNIKPTLEIRPGYQFNVIVTKDVVFKGPYTYVKK
ncbi:MAG: TrbI/VirB10 family protein [Desulfocapsaceae bacterium]|nr:TrbI/VirB10 family protein [Desulfocapsaceae bacterium]